MSGVAVVRYLLANNVNVTAVVPATSIKAGELQLNQTLPAIYISQVSSIPRLTLAMTETGRMNTDRVQVTALIKDQQGAPQGQGYPGLNALMKLILAACPNQHGTINTFNVDSILPDIEGPDLYDEEISMISRSRDFIVKWF